MRIDKMWRSARCLQQLYKRHNDRYFYCIDCIQERSLTFSHRSQGTSELAPDQNEKLVIPSSYRDVIVPEGVTLSQFLFDKQEDFAERNALINGETGQSFTNQEIRRLSLALGSALLNLGYSSGDVLGIISPNCPEFAICILGMTSFGIIPTTISSSYVADEIKFQLKNSESVGIICHEENVKVVRSACEGNSKIRHIISIGPEREGVLSIFQLLKDDGKAVKTRYEIIPSDDTAILPYSSGTTGIPKGVMLTHRNIVANVSQISHPDVNFIGRDDVQDQDILIGVLPFYHIYGLAMLFLSLYNGGQIVTMKKFDQHLYSKMIKKYKPTILPVVPPMINFMGNSSIVKPLDLKCVRIILSGAAPLGSSVIERFTSKFGTHMDILEGYGMTEASPVTHTTPLKILGRLSSGLCAVPNTLTKIVDIESDLPLPPNTEGELCIKGPQVMKGYLKNEEATKHTIRDGWLHTGDIARMDENQNIFIVDRIKELIKVKGLQVAPAELENLLRFHPSIDDVAVIGIPDERSGELPRAFIVKKKDRKITKEELKEFVAKRVAPHKQISSVVFIDEIPKSAAGKILRKNLRHI